MIDHQCRACGAPFAITDLDFRLDVGRCRCCHALTDLRSPPTGAEEGRSPSAAGAQPAARSAAWPSGTEAVDQAATRAAGSAAGITGGAGAPSADAPSASGLPPSGLRAVRLRPPVPMPERFQVERDENHLEVSWRWFSVVHIFLVFFCVVWDSFLIFWYSAVISVEGAAWIMAVFPLAHVAVGLGLTYFTIAGFLNRTRLCASHEQLSVAHGPLPWFGARVLPAASIGQLYSRELVTQTRSGTQRSYELQAIEKSGRQLRLLRGLGEVEQALWLEQELERFLGLQDREVAGEVERG